MTGYNVFTLRSDGRYDGVLQRVFLRDEDAVEFAQELLSRHPVIEVWCGERHVARLKCEELKTGVEDNGAGQGLPWLTKYQPG